MNDTVKMYIRKNDLYSTDINLKIKIDTSNFTNELVFIKTSNNKIGIRTNNYNFEKKEHQNIILHENLNLEETFKKPYSISTLESLSIFKDKLNVCRIEYIPRAGDFIRFYITYNDILYYVEDISKIKNKHWLKKFSKENKIRDKWYLIHYEKSQYD